MNESARVLIGGRWKPASGSAFEVTSPIDGAILGGFRRSSWSELEEALTSGAAAAKQLQSMEPSVLASFLLAYADAIEANRSDLARLANRETGLPATPRLAELELPATASQLRMAADAAKSRSWKMPTLSPAARVASYFAPMPGLAVVIGPNNFPFRFNGVAGGDFAAAIGSAHPVLAKAHPLHPYTSQRLAELAAEQIDRVGLPPATVQMVYDVDPADGLRMVGDDRVAATAFTGSRKVGLELKAAADAAGRPIYLEMSSLNPVVVMPAAAEGRGEDIGYELAGSILNGMGQFCTSPGLVFVARQGRDPVWVGLERGISRMPVHPMVSKPVAEAFHLTLAQLADSKVRQQKYSADGSYAACAPTLLEVEANRFLEDAASLQVEAFGPGTLLVWYEDIPQLIACLDSLGGNLAGAIYSDFGGLDDEDYNQVESALLPKVGRLLNDKVPTGVAVVPAMNHGGPYPASGHAGFTAVGIPASLRRFGQLQCFDAVRDSRLPLELQAANPLGLQRFVDGRWTEAAVTWGAAAQ